MPRRPAIPEPIADVNSLQRTTSALREAVEQLLGQRGGVQTAAVTWEDLVRLGVVTADQVPTVIGKGLTR